MSEPLHDLREFTAVTTEQIYSQPEEEDDQNQRNCLDERIMILIPNRRLRFGGYEVMPYILNGLRDGIEKLQLGKDRIQSPSAGHVTQRIDDRHAVEDQLLKDLPNMGDIPEVDVHGRHNERNAQGHRIQLDDVERQHQHAPSELHTGKQRKNEYHEKVDGEADHRANGCRHHNYVVGEMNLAQQIATINDRSQSDIRGFSDELPRTDAQQQNHRVRRRAIRHAQEFAEHNIHDAEHHERLENRPCDTKKRALIAQPEIGLYQSFQDDHRIAVSIGKSLGHCFHEAILYQSNGTTVMSQLPSTPSILKMPTAARPQSEATRTLQVIRHECEHYFGNEEAAMSKGAHEGSKEPTNTPASSNHLFGKRILITHVFIQRLMGSTVLTLELAEYLQQRGAEVTIFCSEYAEPVRSLFEARNLKVIDDENHDFHLADYDIIWVNSQMLPLSIVRELSGITEISSPAFIFNHMSALDSIADEFPYIYELEERLASLVVTISPEVERKILPYFNNVPPHVLFPNPAPAAFAQLPSKKASDSARRVLIVSNHAPQEVVEAQALLEAKGVSVTHFGEGGAKSALITPDVLRDFDVVITIGKTVQYCLTAGIPVYVYDHFGGFGYLDESDFAVASENNFSGRGGVKKTSNEIATEIVEGFHDAAIQAIQNRDRYVRQFSIDSVLPKVINQAHARIIHSFSPEYAKALTSAERLAYRFYRTWSWANYLEDERARLTECNNELTTSLNESHIQAQHLEENLKDAQKEIEVIRASHAYQVGRALMRPLHYVKMALRGMKRS